MARKDDPWIETSDVVPMFPTLLWKVELRATLREAMEPRILAALGSMRRGAPQLAPGHGWQSGHTLHEREEFRDLVSCINHAAKSVLRFLRNADDAFAITGCWANVLAKGAAHRAHSHPNNFLSGVYYVRTGRRRNGTRVAYCACCGAFCGLCDAV